MNPNGTTARPYGTGLLGGDIWCNPDYSTGSYSPSYSTGGYYNPCYSVSYSSLRRRP